MREEGRDGERERRREGERERDTGRGRVGEWTVGEWERGIGSTRGRRGGERSMEERRGRDNEKDTINLHNNSLFWGYTRRSGRNSFPSKVY